MFTFEKTVTGTIILLIFTTLCCNQATSTARNRTVRRGDPGIMGQYRTRDTVLPDDILEDTLIVLNGEELTRAYRSVLDIMLRIQPFPAQYERDLTQTAFLQWCRTLKTVSAQRDSIP